MLLLHTLGEGKRKVEITIPNNNNSWSVCRVWYARCVCTLCMLHYLYNTYHNSWRKEHYTHKILLITCEKGKRKVHDCSAAHISIRFALYCCCCANIRSLFILPSYLGIYSCAINRKYRKFLKNYNF